MTQIDEPNLDNLIHDALFHKTETEKRQAVKALIFTQIQEARINELERLELRLCKSTQYGIPVVDLQSAIDDRIKELGE